MREAQGASEQDRELVEGAHRVLEHPFVVEARVDSDCVAEREANVRDCQADDVDVDGLPEFGSGEQGGDQHYISQVTRNADDDEKYHLVVRWVGFASLGGDSSPYCSGVIHINDGYYAPYIFIEWSGAETSLFSKAETSFLFWCRKIS